MCELVTRLPSQGKEHAVWLDNLFTNSPQCRWFRKQDIGCSGTVRTTKTEREENKKKRERSNKRKRVIEEGAYAIDDADLMKEDTQTELPSDSQ